MSRNRAYMARRRWSKLKREVESRFADTLRGRLELHTAHYRHAHDGDGRLWITLDGRELVNLCEARANQLRWKLTSELAAVHAPAGAPVDDATRRQATTEAWALARKQGVLGQADAYRALEEYLDLAIEDAVASENVLIRALSMADARLGKRRLRALLLAPDAHPLVRELFALRCSAEQISEIAGSPS